MPILPKNKELCEKVAIWLSRNEGIAFFALLLAYAFLLFAVHGEVRISVDSPGYIDAAVNYVMGRGFTSTYWYAQHGDAFWAGNVPLYQFLLIPWFKVFGVSYPSLLWINFLLVAIGVTLIWRAVARSHFIGDASWRLGAMAFLLFSDGAYYLLTLGRYDPLAFLLLALAAYLLTVKSPVWRYGGLFAVAVIMPWAHLAMCIYAAIVGCLLLIFYPKSYWREVFLFGMGGVMGGLALVGFYKYLGVWDTFLLNIAPHASGGSANADPSFQMHRWGGVIQSSCLHFIAAALCVFLILGLARKRFGKFSLFAVACLFSIPVLLAATGVFPAYYGWCLLFLLVIFLFSMLSKEAFLNQRAFSCVVILMGIALILPGSFVRRTIKNRLLLHRTGSPQEQVAAFVPKVLRNEDRACMDEIFYLQAKRMFPQSVFSAAFFFDFSGHPFPGREADWDSVTVCIMENGKGKRSPDLRWPGQWISTEEVLDTWGSSFLVYRRADRSQR